MTNVIEFKRPAKHKELSLCSRYYDMRPRLTIVRSQGNVVAAIGPAAEKLATVPYVVPTGWQDDNIIA